MENYKVLKCSCCENRFVEVNVTRIPRSHIGNARDELRLALGQICAEGEIQLAVIDEMVVGAIYDFTDMDEVARSDEICNAILTVFSDVDAEMMQSHDFELIDL